MFNKEVGCGKFPTYENSFICLIVGLFVWVYVCCMLRELHDPEWLFWRCGVGWAKSQHMLVLFWRIETSRAPVEANQISGRLQYARQQRTGWGIWQQCIALQAPFRGIRYHLPPFSATSLPIRSSDKPTQSAAHLLKALLLILQLFMQWKLQWAVCC